MKLLVFAHTPPPHHGQSFMVQKMLEGFGGDHRKGRLHQSATQGIECYHVNARVSRRLEDIGDLRFGKSLLMLGYCVQAIWCRFRYGVDVLYYVPAPGKAAALYRDWLVMALCRPFFRKVVLHWHASGLAKWLETMTQVRARSLTYRLLGKSDLSIVLSRYGRADAEKLYPRRLAVVGNGIEDPCPCFSTNTLPLRRARLQARKLILQGQSVPSDLEQSCKGSPSICRVLFLSHCCRDKGLFETVEGVRLANRHLAEKGSQMRLNLTIAGTFLRAEEKAEFDRLMLEPDVAAQVKYVGYVSGKTKQDLLDDSDIFCFPSYIESFGLVLAEAMACGLPIVATRCGALPELVLPDYPCLVDVRNAGQVAEALERAMVLDVFELHRARYEQEFTIDRCLTELAVAIKSVEESTPSTFEHWEHPPADIRPAVVSGRPG